MPNYVALLRAVNVAGTGKLAMTDLKAMCEDAGFLRARTYIASGNVVFATKASAAKVKATLEACLLAHAGKPIAVMVRTAAEMAAVVKANPFAESPPNRILVIFLDRTPPPDALAHATGVNDERMHLGEREIFIHYPSGMGTSKLRIPAAKAGTGRNMNTVAKLAEIAAEL